MIDLVTGIATVPAIVALVNLAKRLGLSDQLALLLAVALGVALNVAQWAWADYSWFTAASQGLMLGLAASGLYDLTPGPGPEPRRAQAANDAAATRSSSSTAV